MRYLFVHVALWAQVPVGERNQQVNAADSQSADFQLPLQPTTTSSAQNDAAAPGRGAAAGAPHMAQPVRSPACGAAACSERAAAGARGCAARRGCSPECSCLRLAICGAARLPAHAARAGFPGARPAQRRDVPESNAVQEPAARSRRHRVRQPAGQSRPLRGEPFQAAAAVPPLPLQVLPCGLRSSCTARRSTRAGRSTRSTPSTPPADRAGGGRQQQPVTRRRAGHRAVSGAAARGPAVAVPQAQAHHGGGAGRHRGHVHR
jgi:hypothetical protein